MMTLEELRRRVFPGESGGDYNALFGYSNRPGGQFSGTNLTDMTVSDALQFSSPSGPYGQWVKGQVGRVATPMGAYQVVGTTLRAAKQGLGLTGNERMTPELQDRIGMWIYQNQGPGAWEAWDKGGGGSRVTTSTSGGQPMGLLNFEDDQPKSFGDRLKSSWRDGSLMDNLAIGFNSMRLNPDPNIGTIVERRAEGRQQKAAANRTAAWLEANGRPDLAQAVLGGMIGGSDAFKIATAPPEEKGRIVSDVELQQMFPGARIEPGLYNLKPDGTANKIGGGGTTVNVGEPMKIMNDGRIAIVDPSVDGGVRFVTPPGSKAEADAATAQRADEQRQKNDQTYGQATVTAIDRLIGADGQGGLLLDKGLFDLPAAGIVGAGLARLGINQEAKTVENELKTVQSQIAFGRLQAMRDASATGAALGAVTERELDLLMSSLGSLQQSTDPTILRENLKTIRDIWKKINSDPVARQFYYGAGQGAAAPAERGDGFSVTGSF